MNQQKIDKSHKGECLSTEDHFSEDRQDAVTAGIPRRLSLNEQIAKIEKRAANGTGSSTSSSTGPVWELPYPGSKKKTNIEH